MEFRVNPYWTERSSVSCVRSSKLAAMERSMGSAPSLPASAEPRRPGQE